jgi:hypothetical protein
MQTAHVWLLEHFEDWAQAGTPGVNAVDPPYPWRGLLWDGLSRDHETPVLVVGETPKQYRIEAIPT